MSDLLDPIFEVVGTEGWKWFSFINGVIEGCISYGGLGTQEPTVENIAERLINDYRMKKDQAHKIVAIHLDTRRKHPDMHRWDRCEIAWAVWQGQVH